jgi:hypothetical protein
MIVSASRRCDIPAHYLDWLVARIEAGHCLVRNPFDARSFRRVSLDPREMDCLVLWTRDPRPLADWGARRLEELGVRSIVHVTLTGYPTALEPGVPRPAAALEGFVRLAEQLGSERVLWRYDPILIAEGLDVEYHLRNFTTMAAALDGGTKRVTLSLVDEYANTRSRIVSAGFPDPIFALPRGSPRGPHGAGGERSGERAGDLFEAEPSEAGPDRPPAPYAELLAELASIARSHGMRCVSCAEPYDLRAFGIEAGACIDAELIERLFGGDRDAPPAAARDPGQRPHCLCAKSVDIGEYGACPAGCVYCYADRGRGRLLHPGPEDQAISGEPRLQSGIDFPENTVSP